MITPARSRSIAAWGAEVPKGECGGHDTGSEPAGVGGSGAAAPRAGAAGRRRGGDAAGGRRRTFAHRTFNRGRVRQGGGEAAPRPRATERRGPLAGAGEGAE